MKCVPWLQFHILTSALGCVNQCLCKYACLSGEMPFIFPLRSFVSEGVGWKMERTICDSHSVTEVARRSLLKYTAGQWHFPLSIASYSLSTERSSGRTGKRECRGQRNGLWTDFWKMEWLQGLVPGQLSTGRVAPGSRSTHVNWRCSCQTVYCGGVCHVAGGNLRGEFSMEQAGGSSCRGLKMTAPPRPVFTSTSDTECGGSREAVNQAWEKGRGVWGDIFKILMFSFLSYSDFICDLFVVLLYEWSWFCFRSKVWFSLMGVSGEWALSQPLARLLSSCFILSFWRK